jgi:hypothetical protein
MFARRLLLFVSHYIEKSEGYQEGIFWWTTADSNITFTYSLWYCQSTALHLA